MTVPSRPAEGSVDEEFDYDFPVPADYDGDGIDDLSTFNPHTQAWKVRRSSDGTTSTVLMPGNEAFPMPVPADYDGVGHAQRAVYGSNGWFIEGHAQPDLFGTVATGVAPFVRTWPAVADYDGDDRADLSYVEVGTDLWHTKGSAATFDTHMSEPGGVWPLATGANLRANIARLTFLGQCNVDPEEC